MQERVWRKGTLLHCWWECKLVQLLWRTVWRLLQKLKTELPYDPAITLLGMYLEESMASKNHASYCSATLLTTARRQKQPNHPWTEEWIKKMGYIYPMEYYSAIKKNEIPLVQQGWTWRLWYYISQTDKDKYHK